MILADNGIGLPIADAGFLVDDGGSVFYADAVGYFASGPGAAVAFAVGFAAYSEVLPQSAAVAFVLAEVAVNGAVVERDLVVFMQIGAHLFGTEFAADKGVDVLNQLRIELIGLSSALFGQPALPLGLFGTVLLPLGMVPSDFAADGAFVAVKLFGDFGDGAVAGQVLDMVSFVLGRLCVAHGNLSCRKGRMLPHTGLFLLWKVALQMRIRYGLNVIKVRKKDWRRGHLINKSLDTILDKMSKPDSSAKCPGKTKSLNTRLNQTKKGKMQCT